MTHPAWATNMIFTYPKSSFVIIIFIMIFFFYYFCMIICSIIILRLFIINYAFIMKTTTKSEMWDVVIISLFCWISKYFQVCLLLIKHRTFTIICLRGSYKDFQTVLHLFYNVDMHCILITVSKHGSSCLSSSFTAKILQVWVTTVTYSQTFCNF